MFCQKCGHKLEENAKFCTECGTAVALSAPNLTKNPIQNPVMPPVGTPTPPPFPQPPVQKKKRSVKKMVALFVTLGILSFVLFIGGIVGITLAMLNAEKDTEQYKMAEAYVLKHDDFKELGVKDSALKLTGFSSGTFLDDGRFTEYAEYRFTVDGEAVEIGVYLEKNDSGEWEIIAFDLY